MMQAQKQKKFCMKCGYQLVGPPIPKRCPECGYPVVHQNKWREGELHLAGPIIVWPIVRRCVFAAFLLALSLLLFILFSYDVMQKIRLVRFSTTTWSLIPFFIVAPIATYLWQIAINSPGSDLWGLHRQSRVRKWILPCGILFWPACFFFVVNLYTTSQPASPNVVHQKIDPGAWEVLTTCLLIPALMGWSIVLLHLSNISLYLRSDLMQKIYVYFYWSIALLSLLVLYVSYKSESLLVFQQFIWICALLTMLVSVFFAVSLAWDLMNCLTHSYESLAREERLAKQNSERYSAPK